MTKKSDKKNSSKGTKATAKRTTRASPNIDNDGDQRNIRTLLGNEEEERTARINEKRLDILADKERKKELLRKKMAEELEEITRKEARRKKIQSTIADFDKSIMSEQSKPSKIPKHLQKIN